MIYNHLDNWDIKHISNNINDIDSLLMIIDDMIESNRDDAYDDGYIDGYVQSRRDNKEEQQ
jgi:hypothetical protein